MAPVAAAGVRAPQAGSTRDRGNPGSSAARRRLPHPRGRQRRSRGAPPQRATQAGISNRQPRLLLHSRRRLTCGQRGAASAGTDGTCASSPRSPPLAPRRQARAAHLDVRGCSRALRPLGCCVSAIAPGGRRWSSRG